MSLDKETKKALADRFTGWEIVELLDIDSEYIIDLLEDEVIENLQELKEEAGLTDLEYDYDNNEE